MKYENIVFLQGDNAIEAMNIYYNKGSKALFQYLEQWHYPNEHDVTNDLGHGTSDKVYYFDNYIMSINYNIIFNYIPCYTLLCYVSCFENCVLV